MPIAKLNPEAKTPFRPNLPATEDITYRGIAARNDQANLDSLEAYLDGLPWSVNYYSQILGVDNDVKEVDEQLSAAYQQYAKTAELELRVQSALAPMYDSESGITSVTGSALVANLLPNANDYFVAEASLQNLAIFQVISVERRSHRKKAVFIINYTLIGYIDKERERYENLEAKTVRRYRFSKERLMEGLSPVLKEEVHALLDDIHTRCDFTTKEYFKKFFNREHMALVIPGQTESCYDIGLVNFLLAIIEHTNIPETQFMRVLSLDFDKYLKQGFLWDALLLREEDALQRVHHKAKLATKAYFNVSSWFPSPVYLSTRYYVYPTDIVDETKLGSDKPYAANALQNLSSSRSLVQNLVEMGEGTYPCVKPVLCDDYYVLSEAFYQSFNLPDGKRDDLSCLEILVRDYLRGRTLSLHMLRLLLSDREHWPVLEQFYYTPLLILLCKEAVRGFYN